MEANLGRQLRYACQGARAAWAVALTRHADGWQARAAHGLPKARLTALLAWLAARPALKPGRLRLAVPTLTEKSAFVFATPSGGFLLAAGADLAPPATAVFQALALGIAPADTGAPDFEPLLAEIAAALPAEAALLARLVSGEAEVLALWRMPTSLLGLNFIPLGGLEAALKTRGGQPEAEVVRRSLAGRLGAARKYQHWLALPIRFEGRPLGLALFSRSQPFTATHQQAAQRALEAAAPRFQAAVRLVEASAALARQRLLDDLGALAANEYDLPETALRIQRTLSRHYSAARVEVLLLSRDQKSLDIIAPVKEKPKRAAYPLDSTLVGAVFRIGQTVRINNFARQTQFASPFRGVAAKLAAPIAGLGVLALESRAPDAFRVEDETTLMRAGLLAATLLENARLRAELTRRAAGVEGLERLASLLAAPSQPAVAGLIATWLAEHWQADLALVMQLDVARDELVVEGQAGPKATSLPPGLRFARTLGVAGEAIAFGRSALIHTSDSHGEYFPVAGWQGGSAVCVPLRRGPQSAGALLIERAEAYAFDAWDLALLESAALLAAPHLWPTPDSQQTERLQGLQAVNAALMAELAARTEAQGQAEERLVRSARLAAVGEMAAGVAHELNNPLTTVTGFSELLLEQVAVESPMRADLELVLNEARRARGVVRRLLDFSRPSEILRVQADLNEELLHVMGLAHHLARTGGVEMQVTLWEDLPPVRVDRAQMHQVFLNLIQNAVQAMPEGGRLTLGTRLQEQAGETFVTATFADTGPGIAPENLGQIFEPFFTTKPAGRGTGLGLSVSYGIVADHGGFIEAASPPEQGATFTVWLPLAPQGDDSDE